MPVKRINFFIKKVLVLILFWSSINLIAQENLLANNDFEAAILTNWSKAKLAGSDGALNITTISNTGNQACLMTTTETAGEINKLSLKSDTYSTSGRVFEVKVMAKTDLVGVSDGLGIKIQIIGITANNGNKYYASSEFKLTEKYNEYSFTKDVGLEELTDVKINFQCGGYLGNYYFDDAVLRDVTPLNQDIIITPVEIQPITNIETSKKVVAFTFDDGPDAELTSQIATLFESNEGRATFFNIGEKLNGNDEIVQKILNDGHEIGNHTMSHSRIPDLETDQMIYDDIVNFQKLYQTAFNYKPKLFRAPFLDYGQIIANDLITPNKDNRVGGVLTEQKLTAINANVYANDAGNETLAIDVYNKIKGSVALGDIVLCHERSHTLEALKTLLPELKAEGYQFVTVSELFRIEKGWSLIQPNDSRIQIEGSNFIKAQNNELILHRHSDVVLAGSNTTNLFSTLAARTSSGIIIKFKTESPNSVVKFRMAEGKTENPIFGVYQNGTFVENVSFSYISEGEVALDIASLTLNEQVEYKITLPTFTDVHFSGIEVQQGYDIVSFPEESKPVYVAFGNSITHGRGQSGTHETYPFLLAEKLNYELFNIGVGGAKTSQVMAEMVSDEFENIDLMTILIGYNDYNGEGITAETYATRYNNVISAIRSKHPNTKLYCITMTFTTNHTSSKTGIKADDFRNVVSSIVENRKAAGDNNIFIVNGEELTNENDLNDAVHLNVEGASNFANGLYDIISTSTYTQVYDKMQRGINLGNTFSAPFEGSWSAIVHEQYFTDLVDAGFTNVRIPIDFYGNRTAGSTNTYSVAENTLGTYTGSIEDYRVDSIYLDRIEEVINWSLNKGLVTILDFHGNNVKSEFIETFDTRKSVYTAPSSAKRAADRDKFRAIWTDIAFRFKNYSEDLIFEVINEPYFHISKLEMDALNTDIIQVIRNSGGNNVTRKIVITGGGANSYEAPLQIDSSILSNDENLIATFHYYLPRDFTVSARQDKNDYVWGTDVDKSNVNEHFEIVKTWSDQTQTPVFLGEFGADNENGFNYNKGEYGDFGGPENDSRVEYHHYIAELAFQLGFSFAAWDAGNKSGKTIHKRTDNPTTINYYSDGSQDTTIWVEDVKNALLGIGYDDDNDGIQNNLDSCPNTVQEVDVDATGCEIFKIPVDNFEVLTIGVTCKTSNNGRLTISAKQALNYRIRLVGEGLNSIQEFSDVVEFTNLSAGSYELCISILNNSDFEQCFNVTVVEPKDLIVTSKTDVAAKKVTLSLSGANQYKIKLNSEIFITETSEFTLDLTQEINELKVSTNYDCQGAYMETIRLNEKTLIYPNPIKDGNLYVHLGEVNTSKVAISLFSNSGALIDIKSYIDSQNQLIINVDNLSGGVYYLHINTSIGSNSYKIIKY